MAKRKCMAAQCTSIKLVECRGAPREMGRQYGEQASEAIRKNIEVLTAGSGNRAEIKKVGYNIRRFLQGRMPDVLAECEGIAESTRVDLNLLLIMNQAGTMGAEWAQCTPLAVARTDKGPVVAKNNDGNTAPRGNLFAARRTNEYVYAVRRCAPARGIPFIHVTYAGWLCGMDALNAEGLGNTHASVGSIYDKSGPRVDIRLWTYRLMQQCRTAREFASGLMEGSLTGKGFSVACADRAGHTALIEAAVPTVAVRAMDEAFVYSTNHFNSPALRQSDQRSPAAKAISVWRYGYLRWVALCNAPKRLADVKRILASHEPWAPCRHGGAHQAETEWSMIGLPGQGKIMVSNGAPCRAMYQEFTI